MYVPNPTLFRKLEATANTINDELRHAGIDVLRAKPGRTSLEWYKRYAYRAAYYQISKGDAQGFLKQLGMDHLIARTEQIPAE